MLYAITGFATMTTAAFFFFFFNDTPTPEISPLPLHAALPISLPASSLGGLRSRRAARASRPGRHPHELRGRDGGGLHATPAARGIVIQRRAPGRGPDQFRRSEEHMSELQSPCNLVCRLLLEKK